MHLGLLVKNLAMVNGNLFPKIRVQTSIAQEAASFPWFFLYLDSVTNFPAWPLLLYQLPWKLRRIYCTDYSFHLSRDLILQTQPTCSVNMQFSCRCSLPSSIRCAVKLYVSAFCAIWRAVVKCLNIISQLWSLLSHRSIPSKVTACRSIKVIRGISSGSVRFCGTLTISGIENNKPYQTWKC